MKGYDRKRWEQIRAKGKRHYVIRYGVIQWGILSALLYVLLSWMLDGFPGLDQWASIAGKAVPAFIVFPPGGILYGLYTWSIGESRYQQEQ